MRIVKGILIKNLPTAKVERLTLKIKFLNLFSIFKSKFKGYMRKQRAKSLLYTDIKIFV